MGRGDKAEALLRQALALGRTALSANHFDIAFTPAGLLSVLRQHHIFAENSAKQSDLDEIHFFEGGGIYNVE